MVMEVTLRKKKNLLLSGVGLGGGRVKVRWVGDAHYSPSHEGQSSIINFVSAGCEATCQSCIPHMRDLYHNMDAHQCSSLKAN